MYFLTPIILQYSGKNLKPSSIDFHINYDKVYFGLENFSTYEGLLHEVYVEGWTFIETQEDNSDKFVKMIFASDNYTYEIEMNLQNRNDLEGAFSDKHVPKYRTGISATFSPLAMKNGMYDLYLYVYENEDNFGVVNTGREFRKDYQSFKELRGGELLENDVFSNAVESKSIKFHIEDCRIVNEEVIIRGWAYLENSESAKNPVYLEVRKPNRSVSIFSTQKIFRQDVGEYYNDDRYNMSGFQARIPKDTIGTGDTIFTVIVGTENRAIEHYIYHWNGK